MNRLIVALAATIALPAAAQADTLYANTFQTGLNAPGGTIGGGQATLATGIGDSAGEAYLGPLHNSGTPGSGNSNGATLTLDTSGYSSLQLSFDLYAVQSVDGNGPAGGGPDPFAVFVNGVDVFDYTFANYDSDGNSQSFGGSDGMGGYLPAGAYAPRTGEVTCGHLGYGCEAFGDGTYAISLALPAGTTTISFFGNTNEGVDNESYGVDNILITGTPNETGAVPEPATWAMMIGGFGLVGTSLRSRRSAFA